jgi:hypothetical protein
MRQVRDTQTANGPLCRTKSSYCGGGYVLTVQEAEAKGYRTSISANTSKGRCINLGPT